MFKNLFHPRPTPFDFASLGVDMHSHLIPGIDDGAKTIEESIELIKGLRALGFKKLITTPHVIADLYPNSREVILAGYNKLRKALKAKKINLKLAVAAEYMLDEQFRDILDAEQLLTLPGNQVLVELGFIAPPPGLDGLIFRLQTKGYRPIIAHAERYSYFGGNVENFRPLHDHGCTFQINLLSLTGRYGSAIQKTAEKLLKAGLVEYLGTDLHHGVHLEELQEMSKSRAVGRILKGYKFRNAEL